MTRNTRDSDVVLMRPDRARMTIPIHETPTACAGAAASYVLRRIAYRAGTYAPGIDEAIFLELHAAARGHSIVDVERWIAERSGRLDELGYGLCARKVASPMHELVTWIERGVGYRGAVLSTSYARLYPHRTSTEAADAIVHAVGLASEGCEAGGDGALVMIDPWSRTGATCGRIHPALEQANRDRDRAALALFWRGWA
jgi:hypothetical protein